MISVESRWTYSGNIEDDLDIIIAVRARTALQNLGTLLQKRIKQRLGQGGSGAWYRSKKGNRTIHQASAPGEPPAPDTSKYRNSMYVKVVIFKKVYRMEFRSEFWDVFGRRLELGGPGGGVYIAPRPHVRPVFEESLTDTQRILDDM